MAIRKFIENTSIIIKGIISFISLIIVSQYFTLLIFIPIPLKKERRKLFYKKNALWFAKFILKSHLNVKTHFLNPYKEDFLRPAVMVANHQTLFDAISISSLSYKFALVTNDFLKRTIFRFLIRRYIDNISTDDGNEVLIKESEKMIKKGYFPLVFPEGPRRQDNRITRFHKGAFYMAAVLNVDIIPIVVYGSENIHKSKWFYFKSGDIKVFIGKRLAHVDPKNNEEVRQQTKNVTEQFRQIYLKLQAGENPV